MDAIGIIDTQGRTAKEVEPPDICPTLRVQTHGNEPQVVIPVLTPDREEKRQNGRRFKDDGEPMFTLTAQDKHGVAIGIDPELLGGVGELFLDGKWPGGNRAYDGDKCAATVTAQPAGRTGGYNPLYAVPIGGCYSGQSEDFSRGIYEGAARTLKAEKGDGCVALGILKDVRSDYGKEIRKEYEAGNINISRHEFLEKEIREDGNSNTIDTVAKDNLLAVSIRNDVEISDDEKVTIQIKEAVKKGYSEAKEGDSINFQFPNSTLRRGRIGHEVANTLDTSCNQAVMVTKKSECADVKDKQGLFIELYEGCVVYAIWYEKYQCYVAIRKLTPRECFRLQAFSDEDFDRAKFVNSDTQLYKQAGNSITTTIARAIGEKLAEIECEGGESGMK